MVARRTEKEEARRRGFFFGPTGGGAAWGSRIQLTFAKQEQKSSKPNCPLIGQDGNIFNLMGIASRTLREYDLGEQAKEMTNRIYSDAKSYDEALSIIGEYVNITSVDDFDAMDEDEGMDMEL